MTYIKKPLRPRWLVRLRPAVITGIGLCVANYGMDFTMDRLGTSGSKTMLNDVAIGILGALAVFFYLSVSHEKQHFENVKERIRMIGELNVCIREALVAVASSALAEDRQERLRGIDEAMDRIDVLLSHFQTEHQTGAVVRSDWRIQSGSPDSPGSPADS